MNKFSLLKYSFGDFLGIVGDTGHPVLAEMRKRIDVDEDMPRLLDRIGAKSGDTMVDVGAFIFDTAIPALDRGMSVLAFEPFVDAYVAGLYNTRFRNIYAYNAPVGNGEWVKFVYECPGPNFGMRRMIVVPEGTAGAVQTVRLDDKAVANCELIGQRVDLSRITLLKIDCEGSEIPTLEGARKLIARQKPALYIEHYVDGLTQRGYTEKDLTDCIESLGYKMEMWGSPPRWDWFCTPQERAKT